MNTKPISSVYGRITKLLVAYPGDNISKAKFEEKYAGIFEALGYRVQFVVFASIDTSNADPNKMVEPVIENVLAGIVNKAIDKGVQAQISNGSLQMLYDQRAERDNGGYQYVVKGKSIDATGKTLIIVKPEFRRDWFLNRFGDIEVKAGEVLSGRQWVQDPFMVMQNPEGQFIFLESYYYSKFSDQFIADQISANMNALIKPTKYVFDGGNILVGDTYALVNSLVLKTNKDIYGQPGKDFEQYFTGQIANTLMVEHVFWVPIRELFRSIVVSWGKGSMFSVYPHLDVLATLAGKYRTMDEHGVLLEQELVLLAKVDTTYYKPGSLSDKQIEHIAEFNQVMQKVEEAILRTGKAARMRFKIQYVPFVLCWSEKSYLSYNNCLVEYYNGGQYKRIILPKYGSNGNTYKDVAFDKIEKDLEEALARVGYRDENVVWVQGVIKEYSEYLTDMASKLGSLRCLSKVLERTDH